MATADSQAAANEKIRELHDEINALVELKRRKMEEPQYKAKVLVQRRDDLRGQNLKRLCEMCEAAEVPVADSKDAMVATLWKKTLEDAELDVLVLCLETVDSESDAESEVDKSDKDAVVAAVISSLAAETKASIAETIASPAPMVAFDFDESDLFEAIGGSAPAAAADPAVAEVASTPTPETPAAAPVVFDASLDEDLADSVAPQAAEEPPTPVVVEAVIEVDVDEATAQKCLALCDGTFNACAVVSCDFGV
jgi:hypothetical protein